MKKAYYGLLTFAIMSLSYDLYYWKMRSAVGVLRGEDKFLCLSSGSICVLIIVFVVRQTTLIISKKPGNTGISRDIRTEFTTDLLLSD